MVEYLYSTKNYKKLLLVDEKTSLLFEPKYVSGINIPGFTRYNYEKGRKSTQEDSFIYLLLTGDKIDPNYAAKYGHLEIVKYLHVRNIKVTMEGAKDALENKQFEMIKWLWSKGLKVGLWEAAVTAATDFPKVKDNFAIANWIIEQYSKDNDMLKNLD
jgi:hypothetical protein